MIDDLEDRLAAGGFTGVVADIVVVRVAVLGRGERDAELRLAGLVDEREPAGERARGPVTIVGGIAQRGYIRRVCGGLEIAGREGGRAAKAGSALDVGALDSECRVRRAGDRAAPKLQRGGLNRGSIRNAAGIEREDDAALFFRPGISVREAPDAAARSDVAFTPPKWVKLVRAGNVFTAYSSDGTAWTQAAVPETVSMTGTVYVGLVVCSHVAGGLNASTFTNVSVAAGAPVAPEIGVSGNSQSIADGDTSPQAGDNTDFGSADITTGTVLKDFNIQNTGTATLNSIAVTTANSEFGLPTAPPSTIAAGGNANFTIAFNHTATGLRTATLNIASDDSDENPYNFSIQGTGTSSTTVTFESVAAEDGWVRESTETSNVGGSNNSTLPGGD